MNDNELRAIIEQVLTEMNVSGTASASACSEKCRL